MKEFIEFMQFILPFLERPEGPSFQTDHDILYLCGVKFNEMSGDDIRYCLKHHFYPGNGEYYDEAILEKYVAAKYWDDIKDEEWEEIKNSNITNCLRSHWYGSC